MPRRRPAIVATLLLIASAAAGKGASPDVAGNWQVNIDCGLSATASILLNLAEDSASGAIVGRYSDCGTFEVPDAIRRVSSCAITPDPIKARVDDSGFALPATGLFRSDAKMSPLSLFSCSAATEIVSSHQLTGSINTDGTGRATSVDGSFVNGAVTARDAKGATCWSVDAVPSCSFDMRRNDLAVGSHVTVSPHKGARVTFEKVTAPGIVAVMPVTSADGDVPTHFQVLGTKGIPIFYDVRTTATFDGTITSCFAYPDGNGDGLVDGTTPLLDENDLRVLHEEHGTFVDRTVRLDSTARMICGATTSLSELAIAHGPAGASLDRPMLGGKLVLRRRRSGKEVVRFTARTADMEPRDPRRTGAVLDLFSASDDSIAHLVMPPEGWRASRNGRVFRFVNPSAPNVLSPVAFAVLDSRHNRIKVVSRTIGLALNEAQRALGVRVELDSSRICYVYAGQALRRDTVDHVVAKGNTLPPLDCADRRMRWALTSSPSSGR
jgi:hypothetical protein